MLNRILVLLVLVCAIFSACSKQQQDNIKILVDMDSLLDAQIQVLAQMNAKVMKKARINDEVDQKLLGLSKGDWQNEIAAFKDLQLDKEVAYRSFSLDTLEDNEFTVIRYKAQNKSEKGLSQVDFYYKNNSLRKITAQRNNQNILFKETKLLTLNFNRQLEYNSLLASYHMSGSQEVIFSKSLKYAVCGEIVLKN